MVEGRLFSEGLHVLGQPPGPDQMRQYLSAYFGEGLPEAAVDAVVAAGDRGIEAVRQQLERTYAQVLHLMPISSLVCFMRRLFLLHWCMDSPQSDGESVAGCPRWTVMRVSAKAECWVPAASQGGP